MSNGAKQRNYTGLNKIAVFRSFAEEATKNSHNTIKAVWTILFTGGTFALLHSFDEWLISFENNIWPDGSIDPRHGGWFELHGMELLTAIISLLLFAVYLLTFYRFYVGNIRVFDMKYDEVFKFINSLHKSENWEGIPHETTKEEKEKTKNLDYQDLLDYTTSLSGPEIFILMVNTLVIVYLTVLPLNPLKFLVVYWILLVLDMAWILIGKKSTHFFETRLFEVLRDKLSNPKAASMPRFPRYATVRWNWINLAFAIFIGIVLAIYLVDAICSSSVGLDWHKNGLLALAALLALANCIIDLVWTWDFYNPKFSDSHKIVIAPQPAPQQPPSEPPNG